MKKLRLGVVKQLAHVQHSGCSDYDAVLFLLHPHGLDSIPRVCLESQLLLEF